MESTPSLATCRALLHEPELLRLKTLHNMGVLDDLQFKEGVAEVLAPTPSPQAPITKKRPREVSLVLSASSGVQSNFTAKHQKSILAFGSYTKLTTTKHGEQILISSVADAQGVPRASVMFECPKCDFTHHLKCSIIFRGLGGSHYDEERKLYHKDVLVTFQKKVSSLIDFVVHKMLII